MKKTANKKDQTIQESDTDSTIIMERSVPLLPLRRYSTVSGLYKGRRQIN